MPTASSNALAAEPPPAVRAAAPVLSARGLVVRYGRDVAVDGIDLSLRPGEVYALLGRNGSGKSSLVRALLGLQPPTAGEVEVLGRDPRHARAALMHEVGYVPEEPQAPPEMTPRQLARFCGGLRHRWDGAAFEQRLQRLGIALDRRFRRLSRGQKKQVELALALAHRPPLVVLDDPTLGLDPLARRGFFGELMGELADGGAAVLLTTHDLDAVEGIADRVGVLAAGRLLVDEPLERLRGRFRRLLLPPGREAIVSDLHRLRQQPRPWGLEVVVDDWNDEAAPAAGDARPMSLEEIFAALHPAVEEA
ncbi:MAG TPA: ABC transporter ATP-binding protein [Thermoanaerobaculia bacterium]|jgi:ABC-2 type transport system ATP-binding protein|nr:ABC transporter ATP-binding protein [Thermoanaerobaculia bacterium]